MSFCKGNFILPILSAGGRKSEGEKQLKIKPDINEEQHAVVLMSHYFVCLWCLLTACRKNKNNNLWHQRFALQRCTGWTRSGPAPPLASRQLGQKHSIFTSAMRALCNLIGHSQHFTCSSFNRKQTRTVRQ